MPKKILILMVLIPLAAGWAVWRFFAAGPAGGDPVFYGNVDCRNVAVVFADEERIAEVLVEEGMAVAPGTILARLRTERLDKTLLEAEASVAKAGAVRDRLENGTRPEEIEQARAEVTAAEAEAVYAEQQATRYREVYDKSRGNAISRLQVEEAESYQRMSQARLNRERRALDLALAGPRAEEVAEALAAVLMAEARLDRLRRQRVDAELQSPVAGVVRSRLLEPGEAAGPGRPVLVIDEISPKWVRAYASEVELGLLKPGMKAEAVVDGRPDAPVPATLSFIAASAEFTPKNVETPDLRTALVFELRFLVDDPDNLLRPGLPATVRILGEDRGEAR